MRSAVLKAAALVASAALFVAACGGNGTNTGGTTSFKGTKKIGYSGAQSGQSALFGHAAAQGIRLAVDNINKAGGVNGYKLEADVLDDGTDVNKAVQNVKQLILQDNVAALISPVTSGQCQAISPLSKENKVVLIAATCNSYQLTTEPDLINPYYVSIVPNTYMEGGAAASLAAKTGAKKIFIVSPNYLFGKSETNAFVANLKRTARDATIVNDPSTWYVPFPTNPRWDSTIAAIQAAKPDLVYSNIFAGDEINFVKQALAVDPQFFQKYPMTTLVSVDELNTLGTNYPVGMHAYMRAPFFSLGYKGSNTNLTKFVQDYQAKYSEWPSDWAIMNYDAVQVWAKGAKDAGTFDADKVTGKIVGASFSSLRGYSFKIRPGDQQANVGETIGSTAPDSTGANYPFLTLKDSQNLKGDDIIMPTTLMQELRDGKCEKNGDPKTTDFANCPSFGK